MTTAAGWEITDTPLEQHVRALLISGQGTMVAEEGLTMVIPLPAGVHEFKCTFAWLLPGGVLKEDRSQTQQDPSKASACFSVTRNLCCLLFWVIATDVRY